MARRLHLLFHHAGPPPAGARKPHLYVTAERLAAHVRTLRRLGYVFTTVTESLAHPAERVACVTFDDGYVDNLAEAGPVLAALDVPATVFVVTADVGGRGVRWIEERGATEPADLLSWEELRTLRERGWEIGSHAHDHRRLARLPAEEQARLVAESSRALETGLGARPTAFAYPYGSYDRDTIAAVREAGFQCAVTTRRGRARDGDDPFQLPRLALGGHRPWHALQLAKVVATHAGVYPFRASRLLENG